MADFIVVMILLLTIGAAVAYIRKEKKRGVRCVGCPSGGQCSGHCAGNADSDCGCGCHSDN